MKAGGVNSYVPSGIFQSKSRWAFLRNEASKDADFLQNNALEALGRLCQGSSSWQEKQVTKMTSTQPKKRDTESPLDIEDSTSEAKVLISGTAWLVDKWNNIIRRTGRCNPAVSDNIPLDLTAVIDLTKVLCHWSKSHIDSLQDDSQEACITDIARAAYLAAYQAIRDITEKQVWHAGIPKRQSDPFDGFTTLQEWCSAEKKKNPTYGGHGSEPDKELHNQKSVLSQKVDDQILAQDAH